MFAVFGEQQGCDEEARDQKKYSDTVISDMTDEGIKTRICNRIDGMSHDDQKYADGPQTIERWDSLGEIWSGNVCRIERRIL